MYVTTLECYVLRAFAKMARLGIVEIGVLNGETTREMALETSVPIFGIDPFVPDSMNPDLTGSPEEVLRNMAGRENFTLIRDYSHSAARTFQQPFDMLFLDGDHAYEAVTQDIEDWWPKLAPGGVLLMHDTAPVRSVPDSFQGWPGPSRAAWNFAARVPRLGPFDTITGFRKPCA